MFLGNEVYFLLIMRAGRAGRGWAGGRLSYWERVCSEKAELLVVLDQSAWTNNEVIMNGDQPGR